MGIQQMFNETHGITPQSIRKAVDSEAFVLSEMDYVSVPETQAESPDHLTPEELDKAISELEQRMYQLAQMLKFEEAAEIRDQLMELRKHR
jgi:excinuclease ABC subunit B